MTTRVGFPPVVPTTPPAGDLAALTPVPEPSTIFGGTETITTPVTDTGDGELLCDVEGCGRSFKNSRGLSRHRTMTHGIGRDPEHVSVARRVQKDVTGKTAPTVDQLTKASGRLLGYGSIAIASIIVDDDPRRPQMSEPQVEALIDTLSAQPSEAEDIMRPLARIFAGTTLNKRVGRKIVDNMDAADSIVALLMLSRRWQKYLGDRREYTAAVQGGVAPVVQQQAPASNGNVPAMDRQGVVVTPDMVTEMRRNN